MSDFINTIDSLGDDVAGAAFVDGTLTEFKDDVITTVGQYAFHSHPNIESIDLPEVFTLGQYSFGYCPSLTTVNLPLVTSISNNAFNSCSSLTTIMFPSATSIGNSTFSSCSSLAIADFPLVTRMGTYAFYDCSKLTTANFPVATSINDRAFYYCTRLATVNFPSVVSIGQNTFSDCSSLTTANFPLVTSVSDYAFLRCTALTTVDFPKVTSISNQVFNGCSALTTANFPVATSIGQNTFSGCEALTTADFPLVTSIGAYAFYGCSKLKSMILRSGTMATLSNTNAFTDTPIESGTGYIYVPSALVDDYKADNNWKNYINQFRALEEYTIDGTITGTLDPDKVSPAMTRALVHKTITSVNSNVTSIGEYAFVSCTELTTADFPLVTSIGASSFVGCKKLSALILRSTTMVTLVNSNAFGTSSMAGTYATGYIYVPANLVSQYQQATNWKSYSSRFKAIEDYPEICGGV